MKKYLLLIVILISWTGLTAQHPYGRWVTDYSKQFWRIFIYQDGIFRLDSATLANAGFPLSSVNSSKIQIFARGDQQYIYVEDGNNNGVMNSGDFIEFYAEHNTGWYDTALYVNHADQPNPNYSFFNDTAIYYLSYSKSVIDPAYRMAKENDVGSYPALNYFNKISRVDYVDYYSTGTTNGDDITDPEYLPSEGWFDAWYGCGSSSTKYIPTKNAYSSGYAKTEFFIAGASDYSPLHPYDHHLGFSYAGKSSDTLLDGYYALRVTDSVLCSSLGSSTTSFTFTSQTDICPGCSCGNPDYNALSYIQVKYPHTLNLEDDSTFLMYVPYQSSKAKLSFSNFVVNGSDSVRFYDITNHKRIRVAKNGSNYDAVIPVNAGEKKCYITSEGQIRNISSIDIEPVNSELSNYAKFTDFTTSSTLSSDYIIITSKVLWSSALDYQDYRNSANGGGFTTLLVDVNELYDQFSYGIRKDPMAIRNFIYYANDNFNNVPKDVFLIGKGMRAAITGPAPYRSYRKNSWYYSSTLIPGFGAPPVDILFAKRDSSWKPIIPIGRLAAQSDEQVEWYLNKVEEYEAMQAGPPQEWMKYVLHFGGGANQSQVNTIAQYLNGFKNIIEDTLFGGYVRTFLKTSSDPIQINTADSLRDLINNGVSLMTFFGHAAGIGFDYSIDYPSNYDNHEKYPFLLALSCLAGDLFNETTTSSEEFVIIEDKGTIGYLASVTKAEMPWLNEYAERFYSNISNLDYGKPVGYCIQQTIDSLYKEYPNFFSAKSVSLEMTLHGDPAIMINSFRLPDYEISQPDVYFTPSEVTTLDSIFTVNIISTNIGRAIDTVFKINLHRLFPDGSTMDTNFQVNATLYKDTFSVTLPVDLSKGVGMNYFTVWLDSYNDIQEISETNNSTTVSLNIKSSDITPVYPYEYAIVPSLTNLTLKASTGDPFADSKVYRFEIDTTDAFNSPMMVSDTITHTGGVVNWNPIFPVTSDSVVYFWRCSPDSATYGSYSWHESSFQYIPGKRGWGQAHFFQFKKDSYEYVKYNKPSRLFEFVNDLKSVWARTGYFNFTYDWLEERTTLNGYGYPGMLWSCCYPIDGLKIIVYDSISGAPLEIPGNAPYWTPEGDWHCQSTPTYARDFYIDNGNHFQDTIAYFINSIPQNDYVLVMSHKNTYIDEWNSNIITAFSSIGASIDTTVPTPWYDYRAFLMLGKKGAIPGSVNQIFGTGASGELIDLYDTIQTKWNQGYIQSTVIGPAASWDSLFWRVESMDPQVYDNVRLNVVGIKLNGDTATLIHDLTPAPIYEDMSIHDLVDSSMYPYLQLIAVMKDDSFHTPYQMLRWQVTYEPMPETALDPSLYFSFKSDTLQEGDSIIFACATHNISEFNMDSLLIHYWVIDANRNVARDKYVRYRPHPAGDTLVGSVSFDTDSLAGLNQLWVEVNPNNDQLEQYHFNNIGCLSFLTDADRINPLLDVTFDGVHIMDNDIVSAKPIIEIRLKDENKFLLLNDITDTALFKVFIQHPDEMLADPVYFTQESTGEEIMHFYPAPSSSDNKCRIEYYADFPEDGTYKLIVQAKDKSRNISGDNDYEVSFEVVNKSTITNVMNWPNPFSTATHFVFTLTGSELPTYFKIQIMTITGKVVREINIDELGSIHIGRNITTYAWDGRDDYGDQLANGVYLYRVVTHINGKMIEKSQTEADKYFKEEFGKMYLMR